MTLALSDGRLWSLESAQNHLRNLLVRFRRRADTEKQCQDLWRDREKIQTCAARHLGLANNSSCEVQDVNTWTKGQFNICVLICVSLEDGSRSQLILRCPMPHKVGEQHCSGATDEKMRAEIASYAWIEEHCPEIPIPRLHGFQLSNNLQVLRTMLSRQE